MDTHIPVDQMNFTQAQARYMYKALHEASRLESLRYLLEGVIHTVDAMQAPTIASADTTVTPMEYMQVVTELEQMRQAYARLDDDYLARGKEVKMLEVELKGYFQAKQDLRDIGSRLNDAEHTISVMRDSSSAMRREIGELNNEISRLRRVHNITG